MDSNTLTNSERIEQEAAEWFCKRDSGQWTAEDQAQFEAWQSSTANRVAYLRINAGWKRTARLKALGAGVPAGVIPAPNAWGDTRFPGGKTGVSVEPAAAESGVAKHFSAARLSVAASVVLALAAGIYLYGTGLLSGNQYSTPVGGLDTVALADGSEVTLNTDTRIRVDLNDSQRRIVLDKGEAFFDVAKDAKRPFVVRVEDKLITAVGTKFSVRREGGEVKVTVTEGKVRIDRPAGQSPALLSAGGIARTAKTDVLVSAGSAPEAEQLLSWRKGFLMFEATPLSDAVAEFNRYNTRKIVIQDPATAALRIGGNFRSNNTDAFLWLLQSGFPVNVERHSDRIVLTRR